MGQEKTIQPDIEQRHEALAALCRRYGVARLEVFGSAARRRYFDALWGRSGASLTILQLGQWNETVTRHRAQGRRPDDQGILGDFGADAGMANPPPTLLPIAIADAPQAFVKFLGEVVREAAVQYESA